MHNLCEPFADVHSDEAIDADIYVSRRHNDEHSIFQHIIPVVSVTLTISIGLLSALTYFSLGKINPANRLDSYGIEHLSNSIHFVISTNTMPTYSAIIMVISYICVGIFLCTAVLLYLLFAHWMCTFPSWSVFYNLDIVLIVALEYFGISIHLSIISSPQVNSIVSFPRTLMPQAISMATAVLLFIVISLFSDTMHK